MEAIETIDAGRAASIMSRAAARETRKAPVTLTSSTRRHSRASRSTTGDTESTPAPLITRSRPASRSAAKATAEPTSLSSVTSIRHDHALPPVSSIIRAVSAAPPALTSRVTTWPPRAARASAMPRPRPRPAPVTTTLQPSSSAKAPHRSHDAVGVGQHEVLQRRGERHWHVQPADSGDRRVQQVEAALADDGCYFGAETAAPGRLVRDDQPSGAAHRLEYCVHVPGGKRDQVEHIARDAVVRQRFSRRQYPRDHGAPGHDGDVGAAALAAGPAEHQVGGGFA